MMKKILIAVLLLAGFGVASYYEHNYTRKDCEVIEASAGGAILVDACGFTWAVEGEGYEVGQIADLKMHNSYTSGCIDDDVIKKVVIK
jgi:hypothetical protein